MRQLWKPEELAYGLKARGLDCYKFSDIHWRATMPSGVTVDLWPTAGKWYAKGYMRRAWNGSITQFWHWLDPILRAQRLIA